MIVLNSDDNAIRMHEVSDGGTGPQELGIGRNGQTGIRPQGAEDILDLVAGANRHGRLYNDDRAFAEKRGDLERSFGDVRQVGPAILRPCRGSDGEEDGACMRDCGGRLRRERHASAPDVLSHQLIEPRLVDGHPTGHKLGQPVGVFLHNRDAVADARKARGSDEADIAAADHRKIETDRRRKSGIGAPLL